MQRTDRLRAISLLLLSLVGTAALFLPFVPKTSPFRVATTDLLLAGREFALLAVPYFLSVPVLAWQAAKLFGRRPSIFELVAVYLLSFLATISVLAFVGLILANANSPGDKPLELAIGPCTAMVLLNIIVLWRNLRKRVSREAVAEAFLLGGYLPNAVFCLLAFRAHLQIGAYLIALVSLGYLVGMGLISRQEAIRPDNPR